MQNMVSLFEGTKLMYDVFFDMNYATKDFDNIIVKQKGKVIALDYEMVEKIKDALALEMQAVMLEMIEIQRSGMKPILV